MIQGINIIITAGPYDDSDEEYMTIRPDYVQDIHISSTLPEGFKAAAEVIAEVDLQMTERLLNIFQQDKEQTS